MEKIKKHYFECLITKLCPSYLLRISVLTTSLGLISIIFLVWSKFQFCYVIYIEVVSRNGRRKLI
jgi:hypothetical protein